MQNFLEAGISWWPPHTHSMGSDQKKVQYSVVVETRVVPVVSSADPPKAVG